MELQDIRTEVRDVAGINSNDPKWTDTILNRYINAALQRISTRHDWWFLDEVATFNLVVGQENYALPSDHRKTRNLWISNYDLAYRQPKEWVLTQNYNHQIPVVYSIFHQELHLGPVPNSTEEVTHLYVKTEPALVNDTDEPNLPTEYMDYLVSVCVMRIAVSLKDQDLYSMAMNERDEWQRRADDDVRKTRANVRIATRRDWRV